MNLMKTKTSKFLIALLPTLALGVAAFAGLDSWTYFNGASRTVKSTGDWIQLESMDKNYCNGRVRLYQVSAGFFNSDYMLEVQGSWCKVVKFGFQVQGNNFVQNDSTMRFDLSKSDGSDGGWSGYGGSFTIPSAALNNMWNGSAPNQLSMVLYTDSRDDTHQQAYEKLTIELNSSSHNQNPGSSSDLNSCIDNAKQFLGGRLGIDPSSISSDGQPHLSHKKNYVYILQANGQDYDVTTNQSCVGLSYAPSQE